MSRPAALALLCVLCASVADPSGAQRGVGDPGVLQLRIGITQAGGGRRIQAMDLETYVSRVLAGEAARDSPPAALEALAVTIRTFALGNRDRHRADGFDLCDDTHCQVLRTATAATDRAARATAGQVLLRNGAIAQVFYSASCGGHTEVPSNVWPGFADPPYLPSQPDDACGGAPAWQADLTDTDLLRALRAAGFAGDRLRDLRVLSRNESGRVMTLGLDGLTPSRISGQDLRVAVGRTLGWQQLKSTAFELQRVSGAYRFAGHGFGHGVGLCVIGSVNLAARGDSSAAILARYFPGTTIGQAGPRLVPEPVRIVPGPAVVTTPRTDILVSLPDDDEGQRGPIADLTARARAALAKALGLAPPATVTLRFHPTTDDYERATGQAWFTSAALVRLGAADEMHFLPVAVLRERGVLERTIRSELVQLMTAPALEGRPAWVREGAAMYFADAEPSDRSAVGPSARESCPKDNELLHPVSAGALSNALGRARACFARQVAAGRSWRDVR